MKLLIQRVVKAHVRVGGTEISRIGPGLIVYIGLRHGDTKEQAAFLARKTSGLRIFEDENGKMNLSALDLKKEILIISQFTLYASLRKGYRPDFLESMKPGPAEELYRYFISLIRKTGLNTAEGEFRAMMKIEYVNDGPVSMILERNA